MIMIELKTYTLNELEELIHSNGRQAVERKLKNYDISFQSIGERAPNIKYTITNIADPFKPYCVFDLGFSPQVDFYKLRHFLYHYFCDDIFMSMPDEVKEHRMRNYEHPISRQTIANYEERLDALGYITVHTTDFIYYFAYQHEQRIVEKAEYCEAWRGYWKMIDDGNFSQDAIYQMIANYGGVARKQAIQERNGIYTNEINYLVSLTADSVEASLQN